jgi:hypothetical protein
MTDLCDTEGTETRETPELLDDAGLLTPSVDDAILVTSPTAKYERTPIAEVDVHTAITNGLAGYLMQLEAAIAGRSTRFAWVTSDWADQQDGERGYPAAAVYSTEVGKYDTSSGLGMTTPTKMSNVQVTDPTDVAAIASGGMYNLDDLSVEVMSSDKIMRSGVRRMLENAFSPVQWMQGFRLVLPRYHNAICTFLAVTAQMPDSEQTALAGLRPLVFKLRARCPVYRIHRLPLARPMVVRTEGGAPTTR